MKTKYNWDHPIRTKLDQKHYKLAHRMNKMERAKRTHKKYRKYKQLWKQMTKLAHKINDCSI
jgi:hypothetical protein